MAKVSEIAPTREAVADWLSQQGIQCPPGDIRMVSCGLDHRNGWSTYLVTSLLGMPYAYTDGPLVSGPIYWCRRRYGQ
jgi:hypothetical protein